MKSEVSNGFGKYVIRKCLVQAVKGSDNRFKGFIIVKGLDKKRLALKVKNSEYFVDGKSFVVGLHER